MRLVALYHPQSDHGGRVEDYATEFFRFYRQKIELLSLESREGAYLADTYDVISYPAFLALDGQGRLLKLWQGPELPLMMELEAYSLQGSPLVASEV